MVYVFGFFGFVMGFAIGLGVINVLLRNYPKEEIQDNKAFRIYSIAVWIFAIFGGWLGVWVHNNHFL